MNWRYEITYGFAKNNKWEGQSKTEVYTDRKEALKRYIALRSATDKVERRLKKLGKMTDESPKPNCVVEMKYEMNGHWNNAVNALISFYYEANCMMSKEYDWSLGLNFN